ncbi:MATE family efflux transporter [Oceanobacillus alkalisoli]|uniref:MATE family efflux transporter n=1 Tax=Oceanobacillus alkalisoli TaxID=2925113 RepID=UPI001EE3D3CE|nr:MATE family efflux transporter [Oceanobacillus alkalisoli]MCG5102792.1 MATE family efflux transporter [Oceanobacillus alkalisoli]
MTRQYDFTEGNILKQLFHFSWPILLTNLLQTSYQFIDSLWVGNLLGATALGAIGISSTILFTVLAFIIGLNNAALTILSQQKGKQNDDGLKRYLNAFVVLMTSLAVLLGVIGFFFAEQLLNLLGTPETMMQDAKAYLQINFMGILFLFGYNFISTVMRALGDSKTPLRFVTVAVVANVIFDPLFISVFDWGIQGAGYATIVSQGLAFLYGFYYMRCERLAPFTVPTVPALKDIRLIFHLGIPSGLQMAVISAGSAAIMSVVTSFGGPVVAGFTSAQRLDSIIMLPAQALSTAITSMAGQNIGVRNWKRVDKIAKYGVLFNFAIMVTIGIFIILFGEYGIKLFTRDAASVDFGARYLSIIALCYPFLGINFILNGVVRAAGAMYQVLILNLLSFWVLRYPLTWLFSRWFGDTGIAMGMGVSFMISSIFAFLYYRYGKFREKDLFESKDN